MYQNLFSIIQNNGSLLSDCDSETRKRRGKAALMKGPQVHPPGARGGDCGPLKHTHLPFYQGEEGGVWSPATLGAVSGTGGGAVYATLIFLTDRSLCSLIGRLAPTV